MTLPHRTYSGRIVYGRAGGGSRGSENFSITAHDKGRLVRAVCEMEDKKIIRDVNWSLDRDWNPIEGYVRILLDSEIGGSAWFKFDGHDVECESLTPHYGRVSQRFRSPRTIRYLGLHPLIGDGLIAGARGVDRIGEEDTIDSITCSYSPEGETGLIALPISIGVTFKGFETVTVPAGTFEARRYALNWRPEWPPADLWVHGDDYIFLKLHWPYLSVTEELVELNVT
jgi:hypothetical protein